MNLDRNRIIIIYDTASDNNDKYWLTKELNAINEYEVIEIYASTKLSQLWSSRKLKNKLRAYRQIISQLTKAKSLIKKEANRKSLVICWSILTGMLSQFVIPKHVPVFSLNWLTPDKRPVNTFLKKRMLNRSTFFVFADSKGTKEEIIDYYSPKSINNIYVFPDTFNYLGEFRNLSEDDVEARRRKRICFTGGRNDHTYDRHERDRQQHRPSET